MVTKVTLKDLASLETLVVRQEVPPRLIKVTAGKASYLVACGRLVATLTDGKLVESPDLPVFDTSVIEDEESASFYDAVKGKPTGSVKAIRSLTEPWEKARVKTWILGLEVS